jgi:hypothetical protein
LAVWRFFARPPVFCAYLPPDRLFDFAAVVDHERVHAACRRFRLPQLRLTRMAEKFGSNAGSKRSVALA